MIVVTPEVLVPLLIESARTDECERLYRAKPDWIASPSWRGEFRRILGERVSRGEMMWQNALARFEGAVRIMEAGERSVDPEELFSFLATTPISSNEAEYLALATRLGTNLVTYDKKLLKMFPEVAMTPQQIIAR